MWMPQIYFITLGGSGVHGKQIVDCQNTTFFSPTSRSSKSIPSPNAPMFRTLFPGSENQVSVEIYSSSPRGTITVLGTEISWKCNQPVHGNLETMEIWPYLSTVKKISPKIWSDTSALHGGKYFRHVLSGIQRMLRQNGLGAWKTD